MQPAQMKSSAPEEASPVAALDVLVRRMQARVDVLDSALTGRIEALRADLPGLVQADAGNGAGNSDRILAYLRNARAREAMLLEAAADARLNGQLELARQSAHVDFLTARVELLMHVLRQSGVGNTAWSNAFVAHPSAAGGGAAEGVGQPDGGEDVQEAVRWLARKVEAALAHRGGAAFESRCALRWSDKCFVMAAYRWLLGRPADENGVAHYLRLLRSSISRTDVILDLAQSPEGRARLRDGSAVGGASDKAFVTSAYDRLLDRGADTGGVQHYTAQLAAGASRGAVLLDLARSAECRNGPGTLGAALRVLDLVNRPAFRLSLAFGRFRARWSGRRQQSWCAGRMAALEGDVARARHAAGQRIDAIAALVEQRVALARSEALEQARQHGVGLPAESAEGATVMGAAAGDAGFMLDQSGLSTLLSDTSAERSPAQILRLVRSELKDLGIN